jgi:polyisoprenoid-binding protein YceI
LVVVVVALALAIPLAGSAAIAKLARAGGADVAFTAVGPAGLKIVGKTGELLVTDAGAAVHVSVPLKTVATGISLRDQHMRDKYLEVAKYPDAVLEVARGAVTVPTSGEARGEASGTMRLHGRQKTVGFKYVARREGHGIKVNATLRLDMRDYGIEEPKYLGLKVKPEVDVAVTFGVVEG